MELPDNWRRVPGALGSGPAVVFDLDGVISDATHRQHFLRSEPPDWRGFFTAGLEDPPIDAGRALTRSVRPDHAVVILTARPAYMGEGTFGWLTENRVRFDILIVRPDADRRPSPVYKRDEALRLADAGYQIDVAFDDDPEIVAMYRAQGLFAMYVHSGYYWHRDRTAS